MSSYRNRPVDEHLVAFGEVGLSGEVRAVSAAEQRVYEAQKMGFTTCVIPKSNKDKMKKIEGMKVIGVASVTEALEIIV